MVTFWLLDSKVWGVIVVNKILCILTQQAMKTHDMTVVHDDKTGKIVLLSKTKDVIIKI